MSSNIGNLYATISPKLEDGWKSKIGSELERGTGEGGEKSGAAFGKSLLGTFLKSASVAAIANELKDIGVAAFQNFAQYEQLTGGVETLFKGSSDRVKEYADAAYQAAGMSANEYMETVTSFSASLLQSLGGDTEQAAELSNQAIVDMSDNANKMGTDMASIQNAYQGFAKQNYTMLDNLKLGYGGTKSEMERLIADANKLRAAQGETSDLTIESYADVIEAIHTVQDEMGITGTTAAEASDTVEGSVNTMKASWNNWLTALGTGDPDRIQRTTHEMMAAAETVVQNALPVIGNIVAGFISSLPGILADAFVGVMEWVASIPEQLGQWTSDAILWLYDTGANIIQGLWDGIVDVWNSFAGWFGEKMAWIGEMAETANEIGSPSKLFYRIGAWDMEGLANGIEDGFSAYVEPSLSMDMEGAFQPNIAPAGASRGGAVTNVYIDGARINDDDEIADMFYNMFMTLRRKGLTYGHA